MVGADDEFLNPFFAGGLSDGISRRCRFRAEKRPFDAGDPPQTLAAPQAFSMNRRTSARSLTPGADSTPLAVSTPQG